jgi:hypothetical protein
MTEDGISRICPCGQSFKCTDNDYFCSSKCEQLWEDMKEEEEN